MADVAKCLLEARYTESEQLELFGTTDLTAEDIVQNVPEAKRRLAANRRRRKLAAIRTSELVRDIQAATEAGDIKMARALKSTLSRDLQDAIGGNSVEDLQHGIRARINAKFDELAEELKPRRAGTKHNSHLEEQIGKELRGTDTGNPLAKRAAEVVTEQMEFLRRLANRAGANIPKLKGWGLPQSHDAARIARDGREAWKSFIRPLLDDQRMLDDLGRPLDAQRMDELLDYVYDTISTEGRNKVKPPSFARSFGQTSISHRGGQHRVLHFKDGDKWFEYQKKYGNEDVWATITNHINNLSNDVGLMMKYGPDPDRTFDAIERWARRAEPDDFVGDLAGGARAVYENVRGFDINDKNKVAEVGGNIRAYLSSAQLGSALWPSMSDAVLSALSAAYHGMDIPRVITRITSFGDAEARKLATRIGNDIEYAMNHVAMQARYEDVTVGRFGRMLSDINYRLGLMTPWFNGMNQAWHLEFTSLLADNVGKTYKELPTGLRRFLDNYDLADSWDAIRRGSLEDYRGNKYYDATSLEDIDLSIKLLGAMNTEKRLAVIVPSARNRAAMNWGHAPGTAKGEIMRSVGQYKNFPVTVTMNMVGRYVFGKNTGSVMTRMGYSTAMVSGMTMMGALAVQVKEIAKGRDPMRVDEPEFWLRAFTTGGSAGILGDVLIDQQTRHGRSPLEATLGPTGALMFDAGRLASSPFREEPAEAAGKAVENLSTYVPFQSLWYGRTFFERNIRNTLLSGVDNTYERRQRERERNVRNRTGQKYYWRYNDQWTERALPQRAPDFGAARADEAAEKITEAFSGPLFD